MNGIHEDTIVAVATPRGRGTRGILRLSGTRAVEIVDACLAGPLEKRTYTRSEELFVLPFTAPFPVALYVMRAPRSYTREDVVEVHAPGAPALLAAMLAEVVRRGARPAEPGEFTKRAFLNGRIDLAQAEAVMAIVRSASEAEDRLALAALSGVLSEEVGGVRRRLVSLAADIEAGLDFVEEDMTFADALRQKGVLTAAAGRIERILADSAAARAPGEETTAVLYGAVNAGKSSIFNLLAGSPEAIVEDLPGTTRDYLEAKIEIEGVHFTVVDTAGVRAPAEIIEEIAVAHSRRIAREAEMVLFVVDSSQPPCADVLSLWDDARRLPHIVILNKADRAAAGAVDAWRERFAGAEVVEFSALTGGGLAGLRAAMAESVSAGRVNLAGSRFLLEERQKNRIKEAAAALKRARDAVRAGSGDEFVAMEVCEAASALGAVTGEEYVEDLLDEVFGRFCLGK